MSGSDRVKEKILGEARQAAEGHMKEAGQEAEAIAKKAADEAKAAAGAIHAKGAADAAARERRIVSVAELEGRKAVLAAKQGLIEELFQKSVEQLRGLPDAEYEKTLAGMVAASAEGGEEVILAEADRARVSKGFIDGVNKQLEAAGKKGGLKLSEEKRAIASGFVLKQGDVEVNNSFESIVKTQRDGLEALAVKMLFG